MLLKLALGGPEGCISQTDVKRALTSRETLQMVENAKKILAEVQAQRVEVAGDHEQELGKLEMENTCTYVHL